MGPFRFQFVVVLRRIFGQKRDDIIGGWRKLRSEELHDIFSLPNKNGQVEDGMGRVTTIPPPFSLPVLPCTPVRSALMCTASMSSVYIDCSSVPITIQLSYLPEPITELLTKQVLHVFHGS
jgi:hypothetical protein